MSNNPHYDVMLTKEAIELLKDEFISKYLTKGKYFNCISYEPNNVFLNFKVKHNDEDLGEIITEISIPHHYVLYIVSAGDNKTPGF